MADEVEVAKAGIDLVEKYADKLTDVMMQYSGPAADLALTVGRVGAIKEIVMAAALTGACAYASYRFYRAFRAEVSGKPDMFDCNPVIILPCAMVSAATAIGAVVNALNLMNIFAWVGVFRPEVYLAAKALGL